MPSHLQQHLVLKILLVLDVLGIVRCYLANDAEHDFIDLVAILTWGSTHSILPPFHKSGQFILLWVVRVLYVFWIFDRFMYCEQKNFLPGCSSLFHSLTASFEKKNV